MNKSVFTNNIIECIKMLHLSALMQLDSVRKLKRLWPETNSAQQKITQLETKEYFEHKPSHSKFVRSYSETKINNELVTKNINRYLLENASKCGTYEIDGKKYFLENTCPFDSIAQIVFTSISDNRDYRSRAEKSDNPFFNFIFNFINYGANHQIYTERFTLLKPLYEDRKEIKTNERQENIYSYDAFDNLAYVWEQLLKSVPSIIYQTKQCDNCGKHETKELLNLMPINIEIIIKEGFDALEKALQCNKQCDHCHSNCTQVTEETNYHIFIDLNIPIIHKSAAKCKLEDLPTVLKLTKQYRLAGVIENQRQHYVAYCKRPAVWEQYDDLNIKVKLCTSNETIIPVGAIYTCIEN